MSFVPDSSIAVSDKKLFRKYLESSVTSIFNEFLLIRNYIADLAGSMGRYWRPGISCQVLVLTKNKKCYRCISSFSPFYCYLIKNIHSLKNAGFHMLFI